jgi:hypothetical protein
MWQTRDKVIPFRLFDLFEEATYNLAAFEKLNMMQAVAHGQAVAMNGRSSAIQAETRKLTEQAFPLVRPNNGRRNT